MNCFENINNIIFNRRTSECLKFSLRKISKYDEFYQDVPYSTLVSIKTFLLKLIDES